MPKRYLVSVDLPNGVDHGTALVFEREGGLLGPMRIVNYGTVERHPTGWAVTYAQPMAVSEGDTFEEVVSV